MKKSRFHLLFYAIVMIAGISGGLVAAAVTTFHRYYTEYAMQSVGEIIIILILSILIFGMINEMAYAAALKMAGFGIKLISLFGFVYVNNERNRKLKFDIKGLLYNSVIPKIPYIENYEQFASVQEKLSYCSLSVSISSLFFTIGNLLILYFMIHFDRVNSLIVFVGVSVLVNLYIHIMSLVQDTSVMCGGYRAYCAFKKHSAEAMEYLYTYIKCSGADKEELNIIEQYIGEGIVNESYVPIENYWYVNEIICNSLLAQSNVENDMSRLFQGILTAMSQRKILTEMEVILLVHIVMCLEKQDKSKAIEWWNKLSDKIPKARLYAYYKAQVNCILFGRWKELETQKVQKRSYDIVFKHLEHYLDTEKDIVKYALGKNV